MSDEKKIDEEIQAKIKEKIGSLINESFESYDYQNDAELDDLIKKYYTYIKTGNQRTMLNIELSLESKIERIELAERKEIWKNAKSTAKLIITKLLEFSVTLLFSYLEQAILKK